MNRAQVLENADIVAAYRAYCTDDRFNHEQEQRTIEAVLAALKLAGFYRPHIERVIRDLLVVAESNAGKGGR